MKSRFAPNNFAWEEATISQIADAYKSGELTTRRLVEHYLTRIEEIDKHPFSTNAVIETNPDALRSADNRDDERRHGKATGLLHGIPVLIKDNIDTDDRMQTTAGSLALVNAKTAGDAFLVQKLREAGAVILGKTNLSEWANFRSTRASSGWSGRGGQTKNPYVLDRSPSGSSSGSAVAVAANYCTVAVGTETDGSVVSPSSVCGIVGIKPTLGLVSRAGIIPISHSQDTAGAMARTVTDAAILLGFLAAVDKNDSATTAARGHIPENYTQFLYKGGLRGARIGVIRSLFGGNDDVRRLMQKAVDTMKEAGAVIVDIPVLRNQGKYDASETDVLLYEFKSDLNAYLARRTASKYRTLSDLIAFNEQNRRREMPYFGQELFTQAQAKGTLADAAYRKALAQNHSLSRTFGIDYTMQHYRAEALVGLTNDPAWPIDWINGDHFTAGSSTYAAVAGYPHITVPAGDVYGLPVGISFFGTAWSEPTLFKLAYDYEQISQMRRPPRFASTVQYPPVA